MHDCLHQDGEEKKVLVLQGGGALGSYQAGAYEGLVKDGYMPDWVAGISIGAINAALIAGNPPEHRVEKLRRFWDLVSSRVVSGPLAVGDDARRLFNETSAAIVASFGVPGFFSPRFPPALFYPPGSKGAIGVYDTGPLRETLHELVDFDYLNDNGPVRLSVGAVQVSSGNMHYFDTANERITADHIMASGALPPGFPPVVIDGEAYWDGGLVSNTPLQYVLDAEGRRDMCVFQVDLFSARGPVPETLFEIAKREKDIRFSSRTRLNTDVFKEMQTIRRAVKRLGETMPDSVKNSADWEFLASVGCNAAVTIVQVIHRSAPYITQSSDYEFSRFSVDEHWHAGLSDIDRTLNHQAWKSRTLPQAGVTVLDLTREPMPRAAE